MHPDEAGRTNPFDVSFECVVADSIHVSGCCCYATKIAFLLLSGVHFCRPLLTSAAQARRIQCIEVLMLIRPFERFCLLFRRRYCNFGAAIITPAQCISIDECNCIHLIYLCRSMAGIMSSPNPRMRLILFQKNNDGGKNALGQTVVGLISAQLVLPIEHRRRFFGANRIPWLAVYGSVTPNSISAKVHFIIKKVSADK